MEAYPVLALQTRFLLKSAENAFAGLDDSHRSLEPMPGAKTAGWLLGHLAVTGDFGRRLAGRKPAICPAEWRAKFNPGSIPSTNAADYPTMSELREAFTKVYTDLADALPHVDAATLGGENPYAPARWAFPTSAEFLTWLAAGHLSYHLGQLVAWRSAAGLGRVTNLADA